MGVITALVHYQLVASSTVCIVCGVAVPISTHVCMCVCVRKGILFFVIILTLISQRSELNIHVLLT